MQRPGSAETKPLQSKLDSRKMRGGGGYTKNLASTHTRTHTHTHTHRALHSLITARKHTNVHTHHQKHVTKSDAHKDVL